MPLRGPGRYPAPVPAPLHWAHSSSAPTTSFAQVNIYQAPTYYLAKPKCYDRHMRFYPRNASFFIYYLCDFGQIIPLSLSFLTGHRHDNRWVVVNEVMHDKALAHCPATNVGNITKERVPIHLEQSDLSKCLPETQPGDSSFSPICVHASQSTSRFLPNSASLMRGGRGSFRKD